MINANSEFHICRTLKNESYQQLIRYNTISFLKFTLYIKLILLKFMYRNLNPFKLQSLLLIIRSNGQCNGRIYSPNGEVRLTGACMRALLSSGCIVDIFHAKYF